MENHHNLETVNWKTYQKGGCLVQKQPTRVITIMVNTAPTHQRVWWPGNGRMLDNAYVSAIRHEKEKMVSKLEIIIIKRTSYNFLPLFGILECSPAPPLLNAISTSGISQAYGTVFTHTCKSGFETVGKISTECRVDGTWSSITGYCKGKSGGSFLILTIS